jgi:uncharacterized protein YyaL (SSP411 family)
MKKSKFVNSLLQETSPYLLQHAYNPVNWFPWKKEILAKAKAENKLLLISIGYSTCHWCHVMERECFENEQVAEVMNQHFINIKVDREERPDVDQVYMNALQLMTRAGGWPLNIVALPDGRPVWGATFVKKDSWMEVLLQLQKLHNTQPETLTDYASKLEQGLKTMDVVSKNTTEVDFKDFDYREHLNYWSRQFDHEYGGTKRAPKFMMPNNLHFLIRFAFQNSDAQLMEYVNTSLTKMAYGGIFDHINGGFSRYSVDERWHVPHFEKMLYDNAQLVSLFSDAFLLTKNPLYKEVVYETLEFVNRELSHPKGGFYSALDADSINAYGILEEGAYYVFTKKELQEEIKEDFELFSEYYNVNDFGKWEKNHYVLIRSQRDDEFCTKHALNFSDLDIKKRDWKKKLINHRATKNRPRLDNKIITSWNGMMIKGFADAYKAFQEPEFLETALKNAQFICDNLWEDEKKLLRTSTNGKVAIDAFLEDYAHLISAFISLYEITFDENWIHRAKKLADTCYEKFFDTKSGMFFFSASDEGPLISKTLEVRDNVIPASNSVMAKNLFWLGTFYFDEKYSDTSLQMLKNVLPEIEHYPPGCSNWLDLMMHFTHPFYEVVIVGENAISLKSQMNNYYIPNVLFAGSSEEKNTPLTVKRFVKNKTNVYVCEKGSCQLPLEDITEAINMIQSTF